MCTSAQNFHELHFGMFARLPETAVNGALIFVGLKAALGTQLWEPWHSLLSTKALHTQSLFTVNVGASSHSSSEPTTIQTSIDIQYFDILYHVFFDVLTFIGSFT